MSFNRLHIALATLLLSILLLGGCGEGAPSADSCPPDDRPSSFGRVCSADGECDGYLVCSDSQCGWPAAMTGKPEPHAADAAIVRIERGDTRLHELPVELARSDLERRRGLAERPCIQPGWGMLFVHPDEEPLSYTVEEMRFAIDIVFADADGVVVAVRPGLEPGSTEAVRSGVAAKYALEVESGDVGVLVGDRLVVD